MFIEKYFRKEKTSDKRDKVFPILVFLIVLAAYLVTAPRTITSYGDSASLITNAFLLEPAHPPGYPLFIILGKIFSFIPIGSVAFRLSIMSSFFGAMTAAIVYKILRLLGLRAVISLVSSLIVAFSYSIWLYAITPEVFVLNNLIAVLVIYLSGKWLKAKEKGSKNQKIFLYLIAFVSGLGLSNHLTIALVAVPVFYFLLVNRAFSSVADVGKFFLTGIVGLTPYIFIVLSAFKPGYPLHGNVASLERTVQYLTRYDYGGMLSGGVKEGAPVNESYFGMFYLYLKLLVGGYTVLSVISIIYFVVLRSIKNGSFGQLVAFVGIFAGFIFPLLSLKGLGETDLHAMGVTERFGILGFLFLGMAFLAGTEDLLKRVGGKRYGKYSILFFLGLVVFIFASNIGDVDKSDYMLVKNYSMNILNQVEDGDIIFTADDLTFQSLFYFNQVEGVKPNIVLVSSGFLGNKFYQREFKEKWPDLYGTESVYVYDIARDIIEKNSKEQGVYFVMIEDPYPLGFLVNPNRFEPQGLLLKADPEFGLLSSPEDLDRSIWGDYNLEGLDREYKDFFAKLTVSGYFFRSKINSQSLLFSGCLECAREELEEADKHLPQNEEFEKEIAGLELPKEAQDKNAGDLVGLAKSRFAGGYLPSQMDFHRTIWDLQRAEQLEPESEEVLGGLGEVYEMMKLYDMAIEKYKKAAAINPRGGWIVSASRAEKERDKIRIFDYF